MHILIFTLIIVGRQHTSASYVHAGEIPLSRFSTEGLTGWESKIFKGLRKPGTVRYPL